MFWFLYAFILFSSLLSLTSKISLSYVLEMSHFIYKLLVWKEKQSSLAREQSGRILQGGWHRRESKCSVLARGQRNRDLRQLWHKYDSAQNSESVFCLGSMVD